MIHFVTVALSGPLRRSFTYHCDSELFAQLTLGSPVSAPWGKKRAVGFYLGPTEKPDFPTKALHGLVENGATLSSVRFQFLLWMANYYFANPADVFSLVQPPRRSGKAPTRFFLAPEGESKNAFELIPAKISQRLMAKHSLRPKEIVEIEALTKDGISGLLHDGVLTETIARRSFAPRITSYIIHDSSAVREILQEHGVSLGPRESEIALSRLRACGMSAEKIRSLCEMRVLEPIFAESVSAVEEIAPRTDARSMKLTSEQEIALAAISSSIGRKFAPFLLHGVTGSGKTLLYCHLAEKALAEKKSVLILTPEIMLSGETLAYLRGYFGDKVALWHSDISPSQRAALYNAIAAGTFPIVVGPRSALFAPLENLGLVVVDEEHDESYKQDEPSPRFHGRDAAVMLAKFSHAPVVLGSGTPSLESYHNCQRGRYSLIELTTRPAGAIAPIIQLVDMTRERSAGDDGFVSAMLKKAVDERLARGEQVILYLNRRGFAPKVQCRACGHAPHCPDCSTALTYHRKGARIICHLCGYTSPEYKKCEQCGSLDLLRPGLGTQKVEDSVVRLFPDARAVRLDSDTSHSKSGSRRFLQDFASGKANLMIGTQMISKGLDFPNVTLVGVIASDYGAGITDFRADEKAFAKLTQVAGRTGRGQKPGLALAQTYNMSSPTLLAVRNGDYSAFFKNEITSREKLGLPPFCRVVRFIFSDQSESGVMDKAEAFRIELGRRVGEARLKMRFFGPAQCDITRLRGKYRVHILTYTGAPQSLCDLLSAWELTQARFGLPATVKMVVDVDPCDMS